MAKADSKGKIKIATVHAALRKYPSVGHGVSVERAAALSDQDHRRYMIRSKLLLVQSSVMAVSDIKELNSFRTSVLKMVAATAAKLKIELE
jgi:predicted transcriptional regulator